MYTDDDICKLDIESSIITDNVLFSFRAILNKDLQKCRVFCT